MSSTMTTTATSSSRSAKGSEAAASWATSNNLRSSFTALNNIRHTLRRQSSSFQEASVHVSVGSVAAAAVILFSLNFPFLLSPEAAFKTYHFAFWQYKEGISHFDNTAWTYGTDYFLGISMIVLSTFIRAQHPQLKTLVWKSRGLLLTYMVSVFAGGYAHQYFTTLESQNTTEFRTIWTVCVGSVSAASGFMGSAGTEYMIQYHAIHQQEKRQQGRTSTTLLPAYTVPDWVWIGYALFTTVIVAAGYFSFQRPACDIFIAGTTQFPSTFYIMCILAVGLPEGKVPISRRMRIIGCVGMILNAPLLPMYPILVQYTNLSLAAVNTLLHTWLLVAWSLQALLMRRVAFALDTMALEIGDFEEESTTDVKKTS